MGCTELNSEMRRLPHIGYVPYDESHCQPGDYRRFVAYALKRGLHFEQARPDRYYDLVVLSERADISVWSRYPHGKVVYDFIDSYLSVPRSNIKQWLRGPAKFLTGQNRRLKLDYWRALAEMCSRADAVVCTTEEQQQQIRSYCKNTHIILDIHSAILLSRKTEYRAGVPIKIVWEGLPSNLHQLGVVKSVWETVRNRYPLEFHIVTDRHGPRFLGQFGRMDSKKVAMKYVRPVVLTEWRKETFSQSICACDIAVIPIDLGDALSAGKPENKLILLWHMGMPVITSSTPAYRRAMERSGVKLACNSDEEWLRALEILLTNQERRRKAGELGKAYAEQYYGEDVMLARWDALFASLGFDFRMSTR